MKAKRIFDFCMAAVALFLLSPLFVFLATLVKATSPGPVFHCAERVGKDGRLFVLFKFRTMVVNADQMGAAITTADDPRVTAVGRLLRRCKMDELPQLWNVLWGDMSLVGPRPEDPQYVARYTPEQRRILTVPPGITSRASILYRNEEKLLTGPDWETRYLTVVMPEKIQVDLDYIKRRSFISDMVIIWQTVGALFK